MRPNLAERAGRWSARHWKTATFGWLAFVAVAIVLGSMLGTRSLSDTEQATGETARAEAILDRAGFHDHASEAVLVQSKSQTVENAQFQQTVKRIAAKLDTLPTVRDVKSPLAHGREGQLSADRHSALVEFSITGDPDTAGDRVEPVLNEVSKLQKANPGYTVVEFGGASADHQVGKVMDKDLSHAEQLSVPITFLVLLFAFGAFVAAGIPVLLAFSGVLGSLGIAAAVSHLFHSSDATNSVMLLMGMAVGVDYSLFYLKREREERRNRDPEEALGRAAATSGRAVLISGGTVMIAMAGMLFAGTKVFSSLGIGAMIVVFTTMVGSLTVLPALLGKLGDRVDRGVIGVLTATLMRIVRPLQRVRFFVWLRDHRTLLQRAKGDRQTSRAWSLVLRPALRFPAISAAIATAVLLVMATPVLGIHTKLLSFTDLPQNMQIVKSYEKMQKAFPGTNVPADVVVKADDVRSPQVQHAIADLKRQALASGQMYRPIETRINPSHTVETVEIPLAGDGENKASVAALETLRGRIMPATVGKLDNVEYAVTGQTAGDHDFNEVTKAHWPIVFAFVLGLAFLLLLFTFRSVVIPLTAIALNLLSVGAAYGALVWIFQEGHLQGLLGFHSNGGVVTWLPLFLFAVLFGLSMDYHVFIVSRIKELVDRGKSTEEAVAQGIATTASTVTSAAAVMVAVFAIFATLSTLDLKQMGVGLAVAVLIDATVIRGVLLPATMKLLGKWNWYLPRWLEWLPQLRGERAAGRAVTEAA
jgi:uncharacterized membrane protein YdfJ with MMPL/SSD domain